MVSIELSLRGAAQTYTSIRSDETGESPNELVPCFFFRPLSVNPIKMDAQIARSFRKNDEQEGDSNLRPLGFDFRIWAFKNMLSKRQNQEPGVVAIFTRIAEMTAFLNTNERDLAGTKQSRTRKIEATRPTEWTLTVPRVHHRVSISVSYASQNE